MGLNHRPFGYEPNELARLLHPAILKIERLCQFYYSVFVRRRYDSHLGSFLTLSESTDNGIILRFGLNALPQPKIIALKVNL